MFLLNAYLLLVSKATEIYLQEEHHSQRNTCQDGNCLCRSLNMFEFSHDEDDRPGPPTLELHSRLNYPQGEDLEGEGLSACAN
jgi:hypothetical protein